MEITNRESVFDNLVEKKYNVFNGMFLNLPFESIANTGIYLPVLYDACKKGLEEGMSPLQIMDNFFETQNIKTDKDKFVFLFSVIQYVERQVVLFDSIEDAAFTRLKKLGKNLSLKEFIKVNNDKFHHDRLLDKLNDFSVRLVFTAHPTQFYPTEVLGIMDKLREQIAKNELEEIDILLQQLGLTSFIKKTKPTPFEEALNIIYYLRYVYYEAIAYFYSNVESDITKDRVFDNHDLIKIGFWPGGDRDGNPFVTADVTLKVADELRMTLMKCYYNDLKLLEQKLTFRKISPMINDLKGRFYEAMFDGNIIVPYTEIIKTLAEIRSILIKEYNSLYLPDFDYFVNKVKIFKTHFACVDIRQNHVVHKNTVEQILIKNGIIQNAIDDYNEEDLIAILNNAKVKINIDDFEDELIKDTIVNIKQLPTIQQRNGEQGCNRYIISNSEDVFSVLFVWMLFKWCNEDSANLNFDIIPLFETMEGMKNAESIMTSLFELDFYRNHITHRSKVQTMMLGFSDGTKDGGYVKANWEIYKTKENLSRVCRSYNIEAIFFDGRGGPPARGGGKTHRFYASQGNNISNKEIQLTIQGQTITSTFGTKDQFIFNTEQMLTAGLLNEFKDDDNSNLNDRQRELMESLSSISFEKYDQLKKHDKFIPYLENLSTLKYYGVANIGSRPGKRGNKKELKLEDLRAISFVGSWSQLKQNVPGYFGIGTAIEAFKKEGKLEDIKRLFNEVPFFKALMLNSMMSVSKSYFPLTAYMKEMSEYKDFWDILYQEFELTKAMLLEISGYETLMEEEKISKKSVKIREKIVLPLLTIQQYALQQIAQKDENIEIYEKMVVRSLYGNINASRNSA